MVSRAGFSADLSGPVMTARSAISTMPTGCRTCRSTATAARPIPRAIPPSAASAAAGRTIEYILDNVARAVGRDAFDVRRANLYGRGERNVTPYGQTVEDNVIHELLDELEASSEYRARRAATRAFNAASPVLKKGIAITPVKFGISFNVAHFNRAGALVHVYNDGSVLVNHGGTEMGGA